MPSNTKPATIEELLNLYQQVANRALERNSGDRDPVEKMLKRHIRQFVLEGGHQGNPLYLHNEPDCPSGWIDCGGVCVPPEIGCY